MKVFLVNMLAAATLATKAFAAPAICDIICVEPTQHDPESASVCNCDERFCPTPQGPGGPLIPAGDVWGWNQNTDSCGPVHDGDQCAGLDVACNEDYTYRWNGVDTCQCLPARPGVCRIACVPPSRHDPNAVSPSCNCAAEFCPLPEGPGGPNIPVGETWAFNATSDECGPVFDPEAECVSLDRECIDNYSYGWDSSTSSCTCLRDGFSKREAESVVESRQEDNLCRIFCAPPSAHDPHGSTPTCNCDERICPPGPECPVNTLFGWDNEADECGCVTSPEYECLALDFSCVAGFSYGWNALNSTCQCLPI